MKLINATIAALLINVPTVLSQPNTIDLTGVIDFHAHTGPDSRPRSLNDFETVRMAEQAGMRGIVIKNHFTMTADRAALAMTLVDDLEVFGGVALNRAVGGINPEAVRQLAAFDGARGKVVWLPTFDSEFYVTRSGSGEPFVSVIENGAPVPELIEVFSIIAENNLVLAMGHSSPEEVLQMIPLAREQGVKNILVTHVFGQDATLAQMQQMAKMGAIMELDWQAVYIKVQSLDDYLTAINSIGAENFLISSDFGQPENPDHVTGMRAFIDALMKAGINEGQINTMARKNPAQLLSLEYSSQEIKVVNGHAHNDYENENPLFDAIENGFISVEVDVHLVDDNLYVSHDLPEELNPALTLETLYLKPLEEHIISNSGSVYSNYSGTFYLMIDFKSEAKPTYQKLKELLSDYLAIIAITQNGVEQNGPVKIFISGNRPVDEILNDEPKLVGIDGRPDELNKSVPSSIMPIVSDNYSNILSWTGDGEINDDEKNRLASLVQKTHAQNKKLRLWAAPDNEIVWTFLLDNGVDLINTDRLKDFSAFISVYNASPKSSR